MLLASNIMVPLMDGSFLLILEKKGQLSNFNCIHFPNKDNRQKSKTKLQNIYLYSILPVVGSRIIHLSFHSLSYYEEKAMCRKPSISALIDEQRLNHNL